MPTNSTIRKSFGTRRATAGTQTSFRKKPSGRCVTPLPEHVMEMLQALPGQMRDGKKYFFTCRYSALRMRIDTLAERAQKERPFTHAFSPHCLRHYAASRTMPRKSNQ